MELFVPGEDCPRLNMVLEAWADRTRVMDLWRKENANPNSNIQSSCKLVPGQNIKFSRPGIFDPSRTLLKGRMTKTKTDRKGRVNRTWDTFSCAISLPFILEGNLPAQPGPHSGTDIETLRESACQAPIHCHGQ